MHAESVRRGRLHAQGDVQPTFCRKALQFRGQLHRLAALQLRIPHGIGTGGEPFQSFLQCRDHALVILFFLVRRIDQHQRTTRWRRQQCFQRAKTIGLLHQYARTAPGEVLFENGIVRRVQLVQAHLVLRAQRVLCNQRRTRIQTQDSIRIEVSDHGDIFRQRPGQIRHRPQPRDAAFELGILFRIVAIQRIAARAGVGIDVPERFILLREMAQQFQFDEMLEHIGMIAGMKSVAITQHKNSKKDINECSPTPTLPRWERE